MSIYGMKPQFRDQAGYSRWKTEWSSLYQEVSNNIREAKHKAKNAQRKSGPGYEAMQRELRQQRAMGAKLMTVLAEARIRWSNIQAIRNSIEDQHKQFPLVIEDARNIDFHFNKKHLEFDFVPMWTLKAKGQSFYLHHIDCEAPWTTRETPDNPSTKGSIRIRRGSIHIDADGSAAIR